MRTTGSLRSKRQLRSEKAEHKAEKGEKDEKAERAGKSKVKVEEKLKDYDQEQQIVANMASVA